MTGYVLATEADKDLQQIFLATLDRWGETQAEVYLNDLFLIFEKLAHHPDMGRVRAELNPRIRSFAHKRHVIYYMKIEQGIAIARILHGAMDVEQISFFED